MTGRRWQVFRLFPADSQPLVLNRISPYFKSCSSASSRVLSHDTRSSANSIAWGGPLPTSFDITSITVMNNNGLSAEPWCRPTFTSKLSVDPISVLTDVVHPSYISCITLMYSSPTFFFLSAHHIIYLGTRSYAFSRSTKIICRSRE